MNALKAGLSVWIWMEITLVSVIGNILQVVLALFTLPFDPCRKVIGRWFRLMGVTAAKLSPMWHFKIHGTFPKKLDGHTVVVSNHVSHMDCFLISHLPWEMKWLAKSTLMRIPFLGWAMALAGDIPVVRGANDSVVRAMARCKQYINQGMPVCIFPEGTRATSDTMLPFKDGAFRLAIETQSTILPLAVAGTRRALPKHSWKFEFARAWVKVGEPISTKGMDLTSVDALKQQARAQIEALLLEIRPLAS